MGSCYFAAVDHCLPAYLIKRGSLVEKTIDRPSKVSGRGGKLAALSIVGGLWVLGTLGKETATSDQRPGERAGIGIPLVTNIQPDWSSDDGWEVRNETYGPPEPEKSGKSDGRTYLEVLGS